MKHSLKKYLVVGTGLITAGTTTSVWAGGFQLNEQSVSSQGTGFAGRSSNVSDATILHGNPAGITYLDRPMITVGGHLYRRPYIGVGFTRIAQSEWSASSANARISRT